MNDGRVYKGEFKDDVKDGQALCLYSDGGFFQGLYKDGKRNGFGNFKSQNGIFFKDNTKMEG